MWTTWTTIQNATNTLQEEKNVTLIEYLILQEAGQKLGYKMAQIQF